MSRIILTKYDNGDDHIVVGYDRPLHTFYWQEFNQEPADWDALTPDEQDAWDEMIGFAGYAPGEIRTVEQLRDTAPEHIKAAMMRVAGHDLFDMLNVHAMLEYPESNRVVDLSDKE